MRVNSKLGICIPTFKRPDQLRWCLESVLVACRPYEVPVVVTDDACDDTNVAVRDWLLKEYPQAKWVANSSNLGIDGNILNAVDCCPSEYAWLLGEDDRLQPNALTVALRVVEHADVPPPFVFVNYASVDSPIQRYLKRRALPFESNEVVDWGTFAERYAWAMGFIGGCLIQKDAWRACRTSRYTGTYFAHSGHILEMIANHDVPVIAESLVLNRCGDPRLFTWTGSFFDVLSGWGRMLALLPDIYDPRRRTACVRAFEEAHGIGTLVFLCYARAECAYNAEMYQRYVKPRGHGWLYNMTARLIGVIPPFVFRLLRMVLAQIRHFTLQKTGFEGK